MRMLSLVFVILLSIISCRTIQTSQPNILLASTTGYETITIASFNIQIFGKTKAGKPDVMAVLPPIISEFDIVAIQEIREEGRP